MTEENVLFVEFIYCACGCGKTRSKYSDGKKRRYIWAHQNRGRARPEVAGDKHWKYRGGRFRNKKGYWLARRPKHPFAKRGYVMEHRIVWEEHHNCCLLQYMDIHHINGNREDNRIENLEPITRSDHIRYHMLIHHRDKKIIR